MTARKKNRRDAPRIVPFPQRPIDGGEDSDDGGLVLTRNELEAIDLYRNLSDEQQFQFKFAMQCEATRTVQGRIARAKAEAPDPHGKEGSR